MVLAVAATLALAAVAGQVGQVERIALCEDADASGSAACDGADVRIQDTISAARRFGFALAVGHLDGDGFADVLIGSPSEARVHVFYGGVLGGPAVRSADDADLVMFSTDAQSDLGFSIAVAATDRNNPVLVGAPGRESPGSAGLAFRVPASFFAARPTGTIDIAAAADLTLTGLQDGDESGYSVAIGPLLAAGSEDLVVGARRAFSERGVVYVVPATASGDFDLRDARRIIGDEFGGGLGEVLAIADFFNDDGVHDLVIGAVGTMPSDTSNRIGHAYVVRDLADGNVSLSDRSTRARKIVGQEQNDFFGFSLVTGDFDGDGLADLVVGAIYADRASPTCASDEVNAGAFYFFENGRVRWTDTGNPPTPSPLGAASANAAFWGHRRWDALGFALAAGDVDGDGETDLLASALRQDRDQTLFDEVDEGAVYLFHGGPGSLFDSSIPAAVCLDCPTPACVENPPSADAVIFGADYDLASATSDEIGFALAAGDIDGDSLFADLAISSIAHDRVYLVRLAGTAPPRVNPAALRDLPRPQRRQAGPRQQPPSPGGDAP